MKVAILGAGQVGRALGGGWQAAGHTVRYGVPSPDDPKHAGLPTTTVPEAVRDAEVVVLATPWPATQEALRSAGGLAGRIVIDCTNPLNYSPETGLSLALGFDTSGGEHVAGWAPGASVFKTLNQTGAEGMAQARTFAQPPVMFVAGDDEARKPAVLSLVNDLGFEAVDAGPLAQARLLEPLAM
ncbi:NAD(P)-binding domain-containing protein, partial [Nostoc sp. NIES-2111]